MPHPPEFTDPIAGLNRPSDGTTLCEWVQQRLEALVDGELEGTQEASLRQHLASCAPCREAHAEAVQLALRLRELPELACPPEVSQAVLAQAAAEQGAAQAGEPATVRAFPAPTAARSPAVPATFNRWLPALAIAAMIVTTIGGAFFFYPRSTPSASTSETVELTPQEVAEAEIELKLALAYLAEVGRNAGIAVRDEMVQNIFAPTHKALQ